jgi:hypothetical protein
LTLIKIDFEFRKANAVYGVWTFGWGCHAVLTGEPSSG